MTSSIMPVQRGGTYAARTTQELTTPRARDNREEPGLTIDPSVGQGTVTYGKTDKEREELDYRVRLHHRFQPQNQAASALETIESELAELDTDLSRSRPNIAKSGWDLTLKDGKLAVVGGRLNTADKAWLEDRLNGNGTLTSAAKSFIGAAVDYLQTSEDNPAYVSQNMYGGSGAFMTYNFADVAGQLNGTVGLRDMIDSVVKLHRGEGQSGNTVVGYNTGYKVLEILAGKLTSTPIQGDPDPN